MSAPVIAPGLCGCGTYRSVPHRCEWQQGRGWCRRCLADHGDPECCTPARLARIISLPAKPCGCLPGDDCGCGPWTSPALSVGTAGCGTGRGWTR